MRIQTGFGFKILALPHCGESAHGCRGKQKGG
jgi:hypothetical protein